MDFQAARYLVDGVVPGQAGNDHPYSTPMGVFETSDGFIKSASVAMASGARFAWRWSNPISARRLNMRRSSCASATGRS